MDIKHHNLGRNILEGCGLLTFAYFTITTILQTINDLQGGLNCITACRITWPFFWGPYAPFAYHVFVSLAIVWIFYKKFRWKSLFIFMFAWGLNDIIYNMEYDFSNWSSVMNGSAFPYGWQYYIHIIGIEASIMFVGLILLRPKFDFSFSKIKLIGLLLSAAGGFVGIVLGFPAPITPLLELSSASSTFGYFLFMYSIVKSPVEGAEKS